MRVCSQIAEACPDGSRGTERHRFEPVPGWTENMVHLRIMSKLSPAEGDLRVFWVNPSSPERMPEEPSGILRPGSSLDQNSFRFHQFRLLPAGVEWDDKKRRVDIQIVREDPSQVFEVSAEAEFVEGVPEVIPDPEAVAPAAWDEEEDGVWLAPEVPNPAAVGPKKFKVTFHEAHSGGAGGFVLTGVKEEL